MSGEKWISLSGDGEKHLSSDNILVTAFKTISGTARDLGSRIKKSATKRYLSTWGFDGYDPIYKKAITDGREENFSKDDLSKGLVIFSLLGLPSRLDEQGRFTPLQAARNWVGGWNPLPRNKKNKIQWTEKHRWQMVLIPFKFTIIPLLKLLTWPFKLAINILKFFTEFLPNMLFDLYKPLLIFLAEGTSDLIQEYNKKKGDYALIPLFVLATFFIGLMTGLFFLASLIGRAMTSPVKSSRAAFKFAYEDKGNVVIGVIFSLGSVMFSAILWAFALPLITTALVSSFPALAEALTTLSQMPVISPLWNAIQGFLHFLSTTAYFSRISVLLSAISNAILPQASTAIMPMLFVLGYFAAPIAVYTTRVVDWLADFWVLRGWNSRPGEGGPLTSLFSSKKVSRSKYVPLEEHTDTNDISNESGSTPAPAPSKTVSTMTDEKKKAAQATIRRQAQADGNNPERREDEDQLFTPTDHPSDTYADEPGKKTGRLI